VNLNSKRLKLKTAVWGSVMFLLISCRDKKQIILTDVAKINAEISKDSIYNELDKQQEVFSEGENFDSSFKKSSDVAYFFGEKIDLQKNHYAKLNNCRAYFFRKDTLSINIGIGNGFTSNGFIINYKNKHFYTQPFYSTDVVGLDDHESSYKIIYENLVLDKLNYEIGDSLYGNIEFKSIETDMDGKAIEHFGKGSFRTKVKKY